MDLWIESRKAYNPFPAKSHQRLESGGGYVHTYSRFKKQLATNSPPIWSGFAGKVEQAFLV